ncbi:transcriptional regulator FtrA [Roseiterribacter gracilis]|uniref:Transcriptional regulator FtrA n=1 Tax=Roseiterribacter gracilis TaxID=2812848 RepID=A0A8S8XBZ4_9PROT|nr:transcriptional regulator FtrA [Rhodospirillales bacterium TMPK1]
MPKLKPPKARKKVVAVVYDGLCSFEFGCAAEVFGLARPEFGANWYDFTTAAAEPGKLRAAGGLTVQADGGLERLRDAGTIVLPGWKGIDVAPSAALVAALRAAHKRGARIVTICSGVFPLAATGLLDGRRATTHWRYADALQARHPAITVDPNVLYVDEGQLLTSAGSAAGLDLCLHLVRRDHGAEIANHVARRLVIAPHRNGGQAQFIERPVQDRADSRLASLFDTMRAQLTESWTVAELAQLAAMSERTFLRRFREATGSTPGDFLIGARVERARELLESTALSIEEVATQSGFGAIATLRHHFQRRLGVSPATYRQRFARSAA